jgi:hypothetical protein
MRLTAQDDFPKKKKRMAFLLYKLTVNNEKNTLESKIFSSANNLTIDISGKAGLFGIPAGKIVIYLS